MLHERLSKRKDSLERLHEASVGRHQMFIVQKISMAQLMKDSSAVIEDTYRAVSADRIFTASFPPISSNLNFGKSVERDDVSFQFHEFEHLKGVLQHLQLTSLKLFSHQKRL